MHLPPAEADGDDRLGNNWCLQLSMPKRPQLMEKKCNEKNPAKNLFWKHVQTLLAIVCESYPNVSAAVLKPRSVTYTSESRCHFWASGRQGC